MTSTSPAERIADLMLQLETERSNATSDLLLKLDNARVAAHSMANFEVFPAGIAEEARTLEAYLTEAFQRLQKLAVQKGI